MRFSTLRVKGLPNIFTSPESGIVMPIIMRMVLVLPAPFGPSSPNMVPGSMLNDRSSTATNLSYALRTLFSSTVYIFCVGVSVYDSIVIRVLPRESFSQDFTVERTKRLRSDLRGGRLAGPFRGDDLVASTQFRLVEGSIGGGDNLIARFAESWAVRHTRADRNRTRHSGEGKNLHR